MDHINIGESITLCQINVEGISSSKSDYLSRKGAEHKLDVIAVQETHINSGNEYNTRGCIDGYRVAGYLLSPVYGSATYVRADLSDVKLLYLSSKDNIFCIVIEVAGIVITNVYKPPNTQWPESPIPLNYLRHPAVCIGDFNSQHMNWGYSTNDENGTSLHEWSESMNLFLVFDIKDRASFFSARWQQNYNPDLCFVSRDHREIPLQTNRKVLNAFPRSQHRPIIVDIGTKIHLADSKQIPRWNFKKADWNKFSHQMDAAIRFIPCEIKNYHRFVGLIKSTAKKCVPRGFRKRYIPGWTPEMEELFKQFEDGNDPEIGDELLELLRAAKRAKWEKTTSEMNFTHSSRKSWSLLRKLGEAAQPVKLQYNINPNHIASFVLQNSKKVKGSKQQTRLIKTELRKLKSSLQYNEELDRPFNIDELESAIGSTKIGKAAGLDGIYPEFLVNVGKRTKLWILKFTNKIFNTANVPPLLMKSMIVAILKQGKDPNLPESYRPIALLSVIYKLIEKMIWGRTGEKIDEVLPTDQAGFRKGRSCDEQILAVTSYIESGFEQNLKISMLFFDLSSAYDTVLKIGFMLKFLKAVPSQKIGRLVYNMLSNRSIRVVVNGVSSRVVILNNGFAQGGVNTPDYFNLYTSDMVATSSRKFKFADDLAMGTQTEKFEEGEAILSIDGQKVADYFNEWRLCLNMDKTESCVFHLWNQMANKEIDVELNGETVRFNRNPKYLGKYFDRAMTHSFHLEKVSQKLKARNNIIQKLSGTDWGANAHTIRTSALALVYSTAEFASPAWYKSAHVDKVDIQLNETMRIISGTVHSTPLPWLHVLTNIAPPPIRREMAAHKAWFKLTENSNLPIGQDLLNPPPHRLISREPIWKDLIIHDQNFTVKERWKEYWSNSPQVANKMLITDPSLAVSGFYLPRKEWKILNRLRTGHGCCAETMFRWNYIDSPVCDCDNTTSQSMSHIINDCPLRRFSGNISELHSLTPESIEWLSNLDLNL